MTLFNFFFFFFLLIRVYLKAYIQKKMHVVTFKSYQNLKERGRNRPYLEIETVHALKPYTAILKALVL